MTLNIPQLIGAVLLLWLPRQWLRLGGTLIKRRSRRDPKVAGSTVEPWSVREPGDPRVDFFAEVGKFRNYLDLLRSIAGAVCIVGGLGVVSCVEIVEEAAPAQVRTALVVKGVVLLVGMLVQTIRYERQRVAFFPPIFYLAGLSVALCDPWTGVFAFIAIWAITPMFSGAQGFLTAYAVLMLAFGHYFSGLGDKSVIFAGFLCFLPVILSLLANRPLIVLTRRAQPRGQSENT